MASKQEMEALWADLSRRLGNDPGLAEVVKSLDEVLGPDVSDEPRRRLRVPYANTTSLDNDARWN